MSLGVSPGRPYRTQFPLLKTLPAHAPSSATGHMAADAGPDVPFCQGTSHRSLACCASAGRAARGVVVVADSSTIGSSSALRSIPPATARDGIDLWDTP